MAHQVETMAYAGELPWHGLGARVDTGVSTDEMLKAAGLDWEIRRERLYTKIDNQEITIPGRRVMVRSSDRKVMTVCGQDWKPLQNSEMLDFFREYAESGGATLETAGSLRGGALVWGLANLKDGFAVGGKDRVNGYLLFTSPHKVGASIKIRTTTVRVVCANTLAMAESGGTLNYSQNHLKKFNRETAKEAIEQAHESLAAAAKRFETLHRLKLSVTDRLRVLAPFFEVPADLSDSDLGLLASDGKSKISIVSNSIEKGPGAEADTAWGVLNGVTHWADHVNGRNAATRMFRSWVGDVSKLKTNVEEALVELV
jgi:phage/plasmid-like protein (TIGR03299 family)